MPEEDKKIENQEKKRGKNWLFWTGLALVFLPIGLILYLILTTHDSLVTGWVGPIIVQIFFFPFVLGIILILLNSFWKIQRREKFSLFEEIMIIICLSPIILFFLIVFINSYILGTIIIIVAILGLFLTKKGK